VVHTVYVQPELLKFVLHTRVVCDMLLLAGSVPSCSQSLRTISSARSHIQRRRAGAHSCTAERERESKRDQKILTHL